MAIQKVTIEKELITDIDKGGQIVILAGATGALGGRIAAHLLKLGVQVRALVRNGSAEEEVNNLRNQGATIVEVDLNNFPELVSACQGGTCVVSALSGLSDVIIDLQTILLNAAVKAGVPRFIPSDYCIDYTKLPEGTNRNLDFRRDFMKILDQAPIASTSILNGMFMELLQGQAPVILFGLKRIFYWGDARQLMDFTTMENTAAFTAAAAIDPTTPRFLYIAGEVASIEGLKRSAMEVTGKKFRLFRAGGLGAFKTMIKITRALLPKKDEVFPPWQGMQYLYDMFTGLPKFQQLDNERYPIRWTPISEVLKT